MYPTGQDLPTGPATPYPQQCWPRSGGERPSSLSGRAKARVGRSTELPEAEAGLSGEAGTPSAPSKLRTLKGGHRPRWPRQPESPAPGRWPVWPFNSHSEISSVIVIKRGAISLSTYCVLGGTFAVSCELSL